MPPHSPFDYTAVTAASVLAVTDAALDRAGELADAVAAASDSPTWTGTIGRLDEIGAVIQNGYGEGAFMARVHPDAEVRAAGVAAEERISKFDVDLVARRDVYESVDAFAATAEATALAGEQHRLLEFWLRDFRRAGHELPADRRDEVQALRTRLVELTVEFSKHLDEYEDALELTRDQLAGLPEDYISGLEPGAAPGTFKVTLDYPVYYPFMRQAVDRDLREELQFRNYTRCVDTNTPLLAEAVAVRSELAAKLGYETWAHFVMEEKMAKHPEAVRAFYADLLPGLTKKGADELAAMEALLATETPGAVFRASDVAYLDTLQRKRDYGVDPDQVAEYFPLTQTVEGMFDLTGDVFGLDYRVVDDAPVWHPDVVLYEIVDREGGQPIARFYADLFPREGKYGHAAAFDLVKGRETPDGYVRPVTAIVANFTKPTDERPSLLRHEEVTTLFHEFGHILHMCLTTARMHRFSGADTEWDFVEAPSQIMEHWTWQAGVLQRFARHYETGEPIPTGLVDQLVAGRQLNVGLFTLRQAYFGTLDLALHAVPEPPADLEQVNREAFEVAMVPFQEGTFFPAGFGHLMGGYDANYYGYLWSKVYGDDMFSVFEVEGITSPDVGRRYRDEVLAPGGSRDGADLLRNFLEREPDNAAFLRHLGLD